MFYADFEVFTAFKFSPHNCMMKYTAALLTGLLGLASSQVRCSTAYSGIGVGRLVNTIESSKCVLQPHLLSSVILVPMLDIIDSEVFWYW